MKKPVLIVLILCLLLAGLPAFAATPSLDEIDQEVDLIFRRAKTVGGSVVVMKDGQMVYARDYGMRNLHKKLPVDENTYFKMGSVTKMASSLALFQLIEDGSLDLDADIGQVFGYEIANPHFPKTPITLHQLRQRNRWLQQPAKHRPGHAQQGQQAAHQLPQGGPRQQLPVLQLRLRPGGQHGGAGDGPKRQPLRGGAPL